MTAGSVAVLQDAISSLGWIKKEQRNVPLTSLQSSINHIYCASLWKELRNVRWLIAQLLVLPANQFSRHVLIARRLIKHTDNFHHTRKLSREARTSCSYIWYPHYQIRACTIQTPS